MSRLFTLTNKKGAKGGPEKQQYKQSDATVEIKGRDKKTITSKCAEIDKLTPELMCVSQAVLQNVIFCHQEESNWILGEPKVLKDKFDAIFASTRYSKALEQVKKTQTELKSTIQEYQRTRLRRRRQKSTPTSSSKRYAAASMRKTNPRSARRNWSRRLLKAGRRQRGAKKALRSLTAPEQKTRNVIRKSRCTKRKMKKLKNAYRRHFRTRLMN